MRDLRLFDTPEAHVAAFTEALGPLAASPLWCNIAAHVVAERAPLLYTSTDPDEAQNLSNWFNLINVREGLYAAAAPGPTVKALYIAHELAHLLPPTPHDTDAEGLAAAFDASERFASYVTELAVHAHLPKLRNDVPWNPLLASWLEAEGWDLLDGVALMAWRDSVVVDPAPLAASLPTEAARLASYGDNRGWARRHWALLDQIGVWADPVPFTSTAHDATTYLDAFAGTAPVVDIDRWRNLCADNVRRAHLLCGRPDPGRLYGPDLQRAAASLDGAPLAVHATTENR